MTAVSSSFSIGWTRRRSRASTWESARPAPRRSTAGPARTSRIRSGPGGWPRWRWPTVPRCRAVYRSWSTAGWSARLESAGIRRRSTRPSPSPARARSGSAGGGARELLEKQEEQRGREEPGRDRPEAVDGREQAHQPRDRGGAEIRGGDLEADGGRRVGGPQAMRSLRDEQRIDGRETHTEGGQGEQPDAHPGIVPER